MEKNILTQFINNIHQFVWWKDLNSTFLGCNDNLLQYFGMADESEIIGKTDYDLFSKDEADFFTKIDREVISSGQSQLNFEECVTIPDQGTRWLSTSKVPLYDSEQNIIGTIGWFNDITEFKKLQGTIDENNKTLLAHSLQLEKINKDLELTNMDLEKFTYAASHDLKGPIRTMVSFTDLLREKEGDKLDEESLKYIEFICSSATRMKTLIDDILAYARTGSKDLVSESTDIHKLVSDKIEDLNQLTRSTSAVVHLKLPSEPVICYPHLIGLIFNNLISNGIKFNESDTPVIECAYSENEDYWIFSVQDNGIGIEPKFKNQIFQPFKRLVGDQIEGSGIGLSICKRVANLHKGDVWLEKSSKGNTVFKFTISKHI